MGNSIRGLGGNGAGRGQARATLLAIAATGLLALVVAAPASAHIERASYWPDPAVETVGGQPGSVKSNKKLKKKIKKAKAQHHGKQVKKLKRKLKKRKTQAAESGQLTGGAVPAVRPLASALDKALPGDTQVVCPGGAASVPKGPSKKALKKLRARIRSAKRAGKKKRVKQLKRKLAKRRLTALEKHPSIKALQASIADAEAHGYSLRPSQGPIGFSAAEGKELLNTNLKLLRACSFGSIQDAVTASHNNDRVVIMPGTYTEPASRARPTNDPACATLKENNDKGSSSALSYKYQFKCPNDQNLIAVMGRAVSSVPVPQPPRSDRHVIPDAGPCIRCNLQMEGSGVGPNDVTVDAGRVASGDGAPIGAVKDVGIRADRADGFVIKNMKVRHAGEHDVYEMETDGFLLDRVKMPFAGEYGVLTFVADHSLIENCDASGNGDSGIYPGATADLGDAVPPNQRRYGTEVRNCDSHHNAGGFSGTDSNAVWIHDNNFYDNTLGFTTDVFTAPGHPGFPQDSNLIENNSFYSNNFNSYLPPCPAGVTPGPASPGQSATAPGGNCSDVVPTVPVPVGTGMWAAGGNHNTVRNNRFWDNWRRGAMLFAVPDQLVCGPGLGIDPSQLAGCDPAAVPPSTSYNNQYYGNVMGKAPNGSAAPNGVDFWWDNFLGNTGNCWHDNGTATGDAGLGQTLPSNCGASIGTGLAPDHEMELLGCFASFSQGVGSCDWFTTPPKP